MRGHKLCSNCEARQPANASACSMCSESFPSARYHTVKTVLITACSTGVFCFFVGLAFYVGTLNGTTIVVGPPATEAHVSAPSSKTELSPEPTVEVAAKLQLPKGSPSPTPDEFATEELEGVESVPTETYTYVPPPPPPVVVSQTTPRPTATPDYYSRTTADTGSTYTQPKYIPPPPPASSSATAICSDGTYSYSANRSGTCSHHGGVSTWLDGSSSGPSSRPNYSSPSYSSPSSGGTVQVRGYTRKDGTYVQPHTRSAPRRRN